MNQEKIGKFIALCRKDNNLTQEQLAKKLGISDRAVSKWENGKCLMDISLLKPLSELLGVSVVEILSGEKIVNEDAHEKAEEIALKTLNYAKGEIKNNRLKSFIITMIMVLILFITVFVAYKGILLLKYNVEPIENYEEFINNLQIKDTIKIYKKTIDEDDYLIETDVKLRNDFENYTKIKDNWFSKYYLYNEKSIESAVWIGQTPQYINIFTSDLMTLYSLDGTSGRGNFTDADRKYFLLRNDINNDLDFLEYIRNNYYIENNLLTSNRSIKENYAVNLFVSVVIPSIESITTITGDYTGYIFNIKDNIREVHILRNDKSYIFTFFGNDLTSNEYINDLLSTLEIT